MNSMTGKTANPRRMTINQCITKHVLCILGMAVRLKPIRMGGRRLVEPDPHSRQMKKQVEDGKSIDGA